MEYVRIVEDGLGRPAGTLFEVVVVGIDARYHVAPYSAGCNKAHNGSLLASFQVVETRRQHHLEVTFGILKTREYRPPEEYVVVALDISDDATTCLPRREAVCCLYIARCDILIQTFHATHLSVMSLTSVTLSIHPFMTRAGLWVVRMI